MEKIEMGDQVVHPDTHRAAFVTRFVSTRFGILAQLDGKPERAWLVSALTLWNRQSIKEGK